MSALSFDRNFDDMDWDVLVDLLLDLNKDYKTLTRLSSVLSDRISEPCRRQGLQDQCFEEPAASYLNDGVRLAISKLDRNLEAIAIYCGEVEWYFEEHFVKVNAEGMYEGEWDSMLDAPLCFDPRKVISVGWRNDDDKGVEIDGYFLSYSP